MIVLAYIIFFLLITILSIATVLFLVYVLESLIRGHDPSTSRRATRALVTIMKQYKPDAKNFYDLGCSRGTLALAVKKALPHLDIHAVDNNVIRIFFAKLQSKIFGGKVNFTQQDIFNVDLRQAEVVYTYLWYDVMSPLEKKLQSELQQGALVVTNTTKFPAWEPMQEVVTYPKASKMPDFETLFVYIKQ